MFELISNLNLISLLLLVDQSILLQDEVEITDLPIQYLDALEQTI